MEVPRDEFIKQMLDSESFKPEKRKRLEGIVRRMSPTCGTNTDLYRRFTNLILSDGDGYGEVFNPFNISNLLPFNPDIMISSSIDLLTQPEAESEDSERISFNDAFLVLKDELGSLTYELLRKFIKKKEFDGKDLKMDYQTFKTMVPQIVVRLETISKKLIDGRLIIPKKKIKYISFDNPEIFEFAQGIPYSKIWLIYQAHRMGLSISKSAAYAGVSNTTVINYWRAEGYKPHFEKHNPFSSQKRARVLEAHEKGMSLKQAEQYSGASMTSVLRVWRAEGLTPHFEQHNPLSRELVNQIKYGREGGKSIRKVAEDLQVSPVSVMKYD